MTVEGNQNPAYVGSLDDSNSSIPGVYHRTSIEVPTTKISNLVKVLTVPTESIIPSDECSPQPNNNEETNKSKKKQRASWGNDLEFLMSCIALSVGLGNVWRFPFTALENGGGAFVIPYIIVLFLVGKPVYYMEMLLGQFSSRGSVKVFDFSPIMRGVGYGQVFGTAAVTTYYATLMALTLRYFVDSFYSTLPWSYCRPEWGDSCINSSLATNLNFSEGIPNESSQKTTSAEFYFTKIILREKDSIDDGIGNPNWTLCITLAISWIMVALIMIKGVKSSGKASYFLAIFPYVVMFILLIRSLTLPGAFDGVVYFLKPQWDKLLEPKVWYAAVTQVFFSLAICFGNIIMYASYNRFGHNIHRDATIVTTLDTFTSLLSGIIIFGILGNLAYESNTKDIQSVVKGGTGLAFISYPDAIAKFKFVPQLFSVLFFIMLFVLGIGSNVGMASCVLTVIKDQFTKTKQYIIVICIAVVGYSIGLAYVTPGGQYILNLVDFHGASFVGLVLAIFELIAIGWIYGVKRFCNDVYFMLGIKTSLYYRICWGIVTPALMTAILIYTLVDYKPVTYNGYTYTDGVYTIGWCLTAFGVGQLLIWGIHAVYNQKTGTIWERFTNAFKPCSDWGPTDPSTLKEYQNFLENSREDNIFRKAGVWHKLCDNVFG